MQVEKPKTKSRIKLATQIMAERRPFLLRQCPPLARAHPDALGEIPKHEAKESTDAAIGSG